MKRFTTQNHKNSTFQIGLRAAMLFSFAFLFSFTMMADPCDGLGGDKDKDGICDNVDNCVDTYNPAQADYDMDGIGDVCDYDHDCNVTSIRRVLNLTSACSGADERVVWVEGAYCKEIGDLYFTEYPDGTATLKGHLQEVDGGNIGEVDIYFSGKTTVGEPYLECANTDQSSDWYFYHNFSGTISGMNVIPNPNHNFQVGFGANVKNDTYGASGWFTLDGQNADFNFDLGEPLALGDNDNDGICNNADNCDGTYNPVQADYDNDGIGDLCDDSHDCTDILSIRRVQNLASSCSGNESRVIWFNGALCKEIGDLYFTEYTNGTATLQGRVQEVDGSQISIVDVTFTNRSTNGTPYIGCADASQSADWYYYGDFSGTIGGMHIVPNPDHNFQVGFGANVKNDLYGASGWFTLDGTPTDFNFDLGEALDCAPATPCSGEITGFQIFDAPSDGVNTLIDYSSTTTYCEAQFSTDIKIRATATGEHESLEFTIAGPNGLHLTNTENYVNYDSKQFWATPGTYTITAKLYRGADLGGTLCDEQTITLVIKESCTPNIGDKVFYDDNKNGIQDNGEGGVENVTVNLISAGDDGVFHTADDVVAGTKVTDSNGNYLFSEVAAGTYCLEFEEATLPNRYGFSYKNEGNDTALDSDVTLDGKTEAFTIVAGQSNDLDFDAGIFKQGSIGNRVWFDDNMDGIQDADEAGVEGVEVKLISAGNDGQFHTADDAVVGTKVTGATGYYRFDDVTPGTYCLEFVETTLPAKFGFTGQLAGTNTGKDSNVDLEGKTAPFTVAAGDPSDLTFDAGIFEQGSIGSRVWHDTNANGILDNNEAGIQGVFIFLEDEFGNELTQYMYQVSAADGSYRFENLPLGNYVIRFATPSGYILTASNQGGDENNDSDADPIEGKSEVIMLTSNSPDVVEINAGYYQPIDLPVELMRFTADKNSCFTDLIWVAATEENFSHYVIEWSSSRSDFATIGYVSSEGGRGTQYYAYTHENTSTSNYYRLKMVDLDGTFEYSDVINISHDCNEAYGMTIFPNLVEKWNADINVKFYTEEDKATLYVVDGMGKMIREFNPEIAPMEWNLIDLDVSNLASGVYYIMIQGNRKAGKFIITE